MSDSAPVYPVEEKDISHAGSSTDQHITGSAETGTFTTDKAPTGDTPADGSSNAGINSTGANRVQGADERGTPELVV